MVMVALPRSDIERTVDTVRSSFAVGLPLLVAAVAALVWVLAGRALRPIERMRRSAEAISETTLRVRIPAPPSSDEVGRLGRTLNHMLDRLDDSAQRQRQFVADASHELRSPIAAIRADVDVALAHRSQSSLAELGQRVLTGCERLEHLVGSLLELAAADEPTDRPLVEVDLADLVREEGARPRATPCTVDALDSVVVLGQPDALRSMVTNLLDNASRHATAAVTVTLTTDGTTARLVVDDDGPGVPVEHKERIFDRFVRSDAGRFRRDGGAGLGLAIVKAVATRHGGAVEVADAPAGGARFTVCLPIADAPAGSTPSRPRHGPGRVAAGAARPGCGSAVQPCSRSARRGWRVAGSPAVRLGAVFPQGELERVDPDEVVTFVQALEEAGRAADRAR